MGRLYRRFGSSSIPLNECAVTFDRDNPSPVSTLRDRVAHADAHHAPFPRNGAGYLH